MSITNYIYTNISNSFSGHKLALINEQKILDWDVYPLLISQTELKNVQMDHIIKILSKISKPYSKMVASNNTEPCSCIRVLEESYSRAIGQYIEELELASKKDLQIINSLNETYSVTNPTIALLAGSGIVIGMSRLWEKLPKSPPGSNATGIAALFCGAATTGYFISHTILNTYISREGSVHRIEWLQKIDSLEKERLKAFKVDLEREHKKLTEELRELENDGETDIAIAENLRQISGLFIQLFPLENLI